MSAKYTFLAWDTPINNAPLKLALLQLANNADDAGFSYYSISKMAIACGMSERTFMRKISDLEKMSILTVERRSNRPSLYTLIGDEMGVTLCHLQSPEVTESHAEVTESHLVGDRESHDPNSVPNISLKSNNIHQQIADSWNDIFKDDLALVSIVNKQRVSAINGCIKEMKSSVHDFSKVETWTKLFIYAKTVKFLMGDNDRNWTMNFDFIITKSKLLKVIEGGY
jgi:AraC-like DNA-binding protein